MHRNKSQNNTPSPTTTLLLTHSPNHCYSYINILQPDNSNNRTIKLHGIHIKNLSFKRATNDKAR